jgi:heme/copper-type cytochrome/quinol oxidase subunit 2
MHMVITGKIVVIFFIILLLSIQIVIIVLVKLHVSMLNYSSTRKPKLLKVHIHLNRRTLHALYRILLMIGVTYLKIFHRYKNDFS